ncbi:hypothetical protein F443_18260 [Phytophthora nicotianae P1569]|uniref:DDE Tnp4 domain-containing protein n=1 Tax=Phytophthora nicotianae P1569 TaxID=1317065 RepID=V9EB16_PHYNI|nr:hypothetical protein F443_18260 [Phytophthora nicotianae P1569]
MPRAQKRQDHAGEALDEADFRASTADLFQRDERRKAKIPQVVVPDNESDSDDGSESIAVTLPSVYEFCLRAEGPEGALKFSKFAPEEFEQLWTVVYPHVKEHWNVGRGKKCRYAARYKMVRRFMDAASPFLYEAFVESINDKWTLGKIVRSGHAFQNFPYARYATDVAFQQANKPAGNMNEIKPYYSGKHHLYGYKVEVSVLPNGLAINCTDHTGGSTHDAAIFKDNVAFHARAMRKQEDDRGLRDEGNGTGVPCNPPVKSKRLQPLSLEDACYNDKLARDRVIVENFFGRLKTLWGICSDKWRFDEASYDLYFRACVALTNVHVRLRPLRGDDGKDYSKYDARLCEIGTELLEKQKKKRKRYQANRAARLCTAYRRRTSYYSSVSVGSEDVDSDAETRL